MQRPNLYLSRTTDLERRPELIDQYLSWLSPEEHGRYDRMRAPGQRRRFLLARGLLRWQLADRLSTSPEKVVLALSSQGKPHLAQRSSLSNPVAFSLSHSGEWVAVAIAPRGSIGVDLEHPLRRRSLMAIAAQFFHPEETRLLAALTDTEQHSTFYHLWTQKEAYLKARGTGIAGGLSRANFAPSVTSAKPREPFTFRESFSLKDSERSGVMPNIWQSFHWDSPIPNERPWFLSLVIDTQQGQAPLLWHTLPNAESDRLLRTESN